MSTSGPASAPPDRVTMRAGEPASQAVLRVRTDTTTTRMVVTVLAAAATVVFSSAVAWDGDVPAWEARPLRWVIAWPDWLEPPLLTIQQAGVLLTPVIVGVIVVWFTRRWQHLLAFALILPLKLALEKAIVKRLVERERPFTSLGSDLDIRGPQLVGLSFPSGHVTTATATAVLLVAMLPPRWRWAPIAVAAVTFVARLYLGQHNLLDCVAGAALGIMFGVVLRWALLEPRRASGRRGEP